jgi:hypothetical protein
MLQSEKGLTAMARKRRLSNPQNAGPYHCAIYRELAVVVIEEAEVADLCR